MVFTPTLAVDFDGVIHAYSKGWNGGTIYDPPTHGAVTALKTLMLSYAVFVHTTRKPTQVARWIEESTGGGIECTTRMHPLFPPWWQWGKRHRFWNTQGVLLVTNRKLPAVAYVDDRAVRFTSWEQTLNELAPDPH